MFSLYLKRFVKNPVLSICMVIMFGWTIYYLVFDKNKITTPTFEGVIPDIIKIIPFVFLVFMIVSYEFFWCTKRAHLQEVIYADKIGKIKEQGMVFAILLLLDLIATGIITIYWISFYMRENIYNSAFWKYTGRVTLIYFALPIVIAILFGWLISNFNKRLVGICALPMIFYLFSSSFLSTLMAVSLNSLGWWKTVTLFGLYYRSPGMITDNNYFLTAENVHIYRILFWISLIAIVFVWKTFRKKWLVGMTTAVSVLFLGLFFMPTGAVYGLDGVSGFDTWLHEQIYYSAYYNKEIEEDETFLNNSKNDFSVDAYRMDIKITDVLKAKVTVIPDHTELSSYQFTLYHGYKVKHVWDADGKEMDFQQKSDFLEVKNNGNNVNEICIEYMGYAPYFYSTSQGLNLPGNFAYYPIPGWKKIYENEGHEYKANFLEKDAVFAVSVDIKSDYPLYSNFITTGGEKEKGYYHWSVQGEGKAMALIGNPYLTEKEVEGVRVIYSTLDYVDDPELSAEEYKEGFAELKKNGYSLKGKSFIVAPEGMYQNHYIAEDHIYDRGFSIVFSVEEFYGGSDGE